MCEICSKLTIKTSERPPEVVVVSLLLTLNWFHSWFWCFHFESSIRPHLDYEDIIFDQAYSKLYQHSLESIQYVLLTITGVIRHTSKGKFYQELGLESLQHKHWFCNSRVICTSYYRCKLGRPLQHTQQYFLWYF